jgi:type IV secretion system protein VirB9
MRFNTRKIRNIFLSCFTMLSLIFGIVSGTQAGNAPRAIGGENRIKIINYTPNTVFKYVGHYTYLSIIEFADDEEIESISMGTPTPWQIVPAGNRIFLKPIEDDATTDMIVITNRRTYIFEMHAEEAKSINDKNLSFIVKFIYPDSNNFHSLQPATAASGPDLSKPEGFNFGYSIAGDSHDIEPLQVFDDGEFTYFKFRDINAEIPAIFLTSRNGVESLVNFRISGGYVVVERVAERFTLRNGTDVICVFNEKLEKERGVKRNKG